MRSILHNANVEVLSIQPDDFSLGLALYESRLDKGYSLTDCTAMNAMRRKGITEVLSGDKHLCPGRLHCLAVIVKVSWRKARSLPTLNNY